MDVVVVASNYVIILKRPRYGEVITKFNMNTMFSTNINTWMFCNAWIPAPTRQAATSQHPHVVRERICSPRLGFDERAGSLSRRVSASGCRRTLQSVELALLNGCVAARGLKASGATVRHARQSVVASRALDAQLRNLGRPVVT